MVFINDLDSTYITTARLSQAVNTPCIQSIVTLNNCSLLRVCSFTLLLRLLNAIDFFCIIDVVPFVSGVVFRSIVVRCALHIPLFMDAGTSTRFQIQLNNLLDYQLLIATCINASVVTATSLELLQRISLLPCIGRNSSDMSHL